MAQGKDEGAKWIEARARWEAEPKLTYGDLAESLGISKQAVSQHAKKWGWAKRLDMPTIAARAHEKADRAIEQNPVGSSESESDVYARANFSPSVVRAPLSADATPEEAHQVAADAAVDARAELLTRHRREWTVVRNLAYLAIKEKDLTRARTAKTAAEAVKTIQDGERKAWGLDTGDDGPVKVVVQRGGA